MGWKNDYKSRLVGLEEALQGLRDGDRVVIPLTEQPMDLISQLMKEASRLSNVSICVSTPAFDMSLLIEQGVDVEVEVFLGPLARQYENEGIAPFLPLPFSMTFKANDERPQEAKSIDVCLNAVQESIAPAINLIGLHKINLKLILNEDKNTCLH